MALYVLKFGGASLATTLKIEEAAGIIGTYVTQGHQVVVVVSAMGAETNRLLALAQEVQSNPDPRALDLILAAGEQVSCGLMSMALNKLGFNAAPLLGWQLPLLTTDQPTKALVQAIESSALQFHLDQKCIPVVAGFQGVTAEGHITTFGRGGSDLTAVAIAAALKAEDCILFKEVAGIGTADPNLVDNPKIIEHLSYEEMLELASLGSKVVQPRAVLMAMSQDIPLRICPVQDPSKPGTQISSLKALPEHEHVTGIVCQRNDTKIFLDQVPQSPSISAILFQELSKANISIDMILQKNAGDAKAADGLTFSVAQEDQERTLAILHQLQPALGHKRVQLLDRLAKISLVGSGLKTHSAVSRKVFETLASQGIQMHDIVISEIKMSFFVSKDYARQATQALCTTFDLNYKDLDHDHISHAYAS